MDFFVEKPSAPKRSMAYHLHVAQINLLMSSADCLCKQFGPRNIGPELDQNCLTLLLYSCNKFLKRLILKKSTNDDKP